MSTPSTPFEQQQWALQQLGDATRALREAERVLDDHQQNPSSGWARLTFHYVDQSNPHNTTKAQVGLGDVMNYGIATNPQALGGVANNAYMTPLRTEEVIRDRLGSLTAAVGTSTTPATTSGHIQLDPSAATYYSKTVASLQHIAVAPLGVDRMATIQLTLTKNVAGTPVVRLGSDSSGPAGVKLANSADDNAQGTYLYTIYVGYGVPLAYRVDALT